MMGARLSAWIGAALFLLLPLAGRAELYQWRQIVDEDEAVRIVRDFEGDPHAKVKITRTPRLPSVEPPTLLELWRYYELETVRYRYTIWVYHGKVICLDKQYLNDPERHPVYKIGEKPDRSRMIPGTRARAVAVQYLRKHYAASDAVYDENDPPRARMPYGPERPYDLSFTQHLAEGVRGPNRCYIGVDSIHGRVIEYRANIYPLLVSPVPTLSAREAASAAVATMGLRNASLLEIKGPWVSSPDAMGMQHLEYGLVMDGRSPWISGIGWDAFSFWIADLSEPWALTPISRDDRWTVCVDAHDGTVSEWYPTQGMRSYPLDEPVRPARKHVYRPLRVKKGDKGIAFRCLSVGGRPFVPAEYLCYGDPTARMVRKGDALTIEGKKRHVRLSLESRDYSQDGHQKRLPAGPVMVYGVPYVHASALKGIVPFRFGYRWWTQTLWLVTPPPIRWTDFVALYIVVLAAALVLLILRMKSRRRGRRERTPAVHQGDTR